MNTYIFGILSLGIMLVCSACSSQYETNRYERLSAELASVSREREKITEEKIDLKRRLSDATRDDDYTPYRIRKIRGY
ncbi:MAG: hypothetical protein IKW49_01950 [Opitutales bacterium]|nr:hypothetical protein [Opitutales bacterium]